MNIKIFKDYIKDDSKELEDIKNKLWDKYRTSYRDLLKVGFYNPSDYLLDKDVLNTIEGFVNTNLFKK